MAAKKKKYRRLWQELVRLSENEVEPIYLYIMNIDFLAHNLKHVEICLRDYEQSTPKLECMRFIRHNTLERCAKILSQEIAERLLFNGF